MCMCVCGIPCVPSTVHCYQCTPTFITFLSNSFATLFTTFIPNNNAMWPDSGIGKCTLWKKKKGKKCSEKGKNEWQVRLNRKNEKRTHNEWNQLHDCINICLQMLWLIEFSIAICEKTCVTWNVYRCAIPLCDISFVTNDNNKRLTIVSKKKI